jgi:hypothetical protein
MDFGYWVPFLCTTGAEALYSDLGHCGRKNIRVSWVFVKSCLVLHYLGQGAWLLSHHKTAVFAAKADLSKLKVLYPQAEEIIKPIYGMMPTWFVLPGIIIATAAAIIASQALISGSFTLISEAMRLNLWPKMRIKYPTEARGLIIHCSHQYHVVCRLCRHCFIFSRIRQNGSSLWISHYIMYVGYHHIICKLYDYSKEPTLLYLSFSVGIFSHRNGFFNS